MWTKPATQGRECKTCPEVKLIPDPEHGDWMAMCPVCQTVWCYAYQKGAP